MLLAVGSHFEEIEGELIAVTELREKPSGTIRITTAEHTAESILWPVLTKFLSKYPDIKMEINIDYSLTDIVAQRFDASVRLGKQVGKDMIAVAPPPDRAGHADGCGGETPAYFVDRLKPAIPRNLMEHNCINLRLPTYGGLLCLGIRER